MRRFDEPDYVVSSRDVYDHSVEQYLDAVGTTVSSEFETTTDLAMLTAFAHDIRTQSPGVVVDAGCGPGRVTRFLADAGVDVSGLDVSGLDVSGLDVSSRMIEAARSAHPHRQKGCTPSGTSPIEC